MCSVQMACAGLFLCLCFLLPQCTLWRAAANLGLLAIPLRSFWGVVHKSRLV